MSAMSTEEDADQQKKYLKWSDELQEAYLEALNQCGGLQEARPKTLLSMLQPRFPFLTLQNVKNHLQKQRTRTFSGGGAGGHGGMGSPTGSQDEANISDQGPAGGGTVNGTARTQQVAPVDAQPGSFVDLTKRALALTVHQLALHRKLLAELEAQEGDAAALVAALREDATGQTVVMQAQVFSSSTAAPSFSSGNGGCGAGDEGRPARLRRLLARLLPPNPFSSGPKGEAALKLAAWLAAVAGEQGQAGTTGTAGGGAAAPATLAPTSRTLVATPDVAGGVSRGPGTGVAGGATGTAAGATAVSGPSSTHVGGAVSGGGGGEKPGPRARPGGAEGLQQTSAQLAPHQQQAPQQPYAQHQPCKRHKPLGEFLAEIPLPESQPPPHQLLAGAAAAPPPQAAAPAGAAVTAGGSGAAPGAPLVPAAPTTTTAAGGGEGGGVAPAASNPLSPAITLLLQQHLQQQPQQRGAPDSKLLQGQREGGTAMEVDTDSVMLNALDAQMGSLLLQSVSNVLMHSAAQQESGGAGAAAAGAHTAQGTAAGPISGGGGGTGISQPQPAAVPSQPGGMAATGLGPLQLPDGFLGLGDEVLPSGSFNPSVLRSFLDMLSSGGLSPLTSSGVPDHTGQLTTQALLGQAAPPAHLAAPPAGQPPAPPGATAATTAAPAVPTAAVAAVQPPQQSPFLGVTSSGGGGSGGASGGSGAALGSSGSGGVGGVRALSAFSPPRPSSGSGGAAGGQ